MRVIFCTRRFARHRCRRGVHHDSGFRSDRRSRPRRKRSNSPRHRQATTAPTTKGRTARPANRGHRPPHRGATAARSGLGLGVQRARARPHPGAGYDRASGRGSQPQHRPGPWLVQRDQHLHPRHRPARRAADLRPGRRRLCRRRLSVAASAAPSSTCSTRAHRSAARAAGHALRQEHDRRRDQVRHPQARHRTSAPTRRRDRHPTTSSSQGLVSGPLAKRLGSASPSFAPSATASSGTGHSTAVTTTRTPWRSVAAMRSRRRPASASTSRADYCPTTPR